MAKFGIRTIDELCGRTDLLKLKDKQGFKRAGLVDLSRLLAKPEEDWKSNRDVFKFELEKKLDLTSLLPNYEKEFSANAAKNASQITVHSVDRTFGTILGSEIQKKSGNTLKDDSYIVNCKGGGGQSFAAFIPKGLTIRLEGDANDAFGKGLSGGKVVLFPPKDFEGKADENIIVGNVALFGATSGKAFIAGVAGERFCVRNSGATVVAEGCGDHGLEYMTGGRAVILGKTGKNLCAGMSGGLAYILDENHDIYRHLNRELVQMYDLDDKTTALIDGSGDEELLHSLIEEHAKETGSVKAAAILKDWEHYKTCFKKIIPNDYLKMMTAISAGEKEGLDHDDAVMQAFKKMTA